MSIPPAVVFVFAHQDDEMAAISRIELEARRSAVFCVFLTDGTGGGAASDVRNRESVDVLTRAGVRRSHILFPGSEIPVPDGSLVHRLDAALDDLERRMAGIDVRTVYCLAWEGGHQDHDASHLVAVAFARRRRLLDQCFQIPLYRRLIGPFFRVFSPLPGGSPPIRRRLTFRTGLRLSMLAWRYRSQRRSWIGLFPEALLKLAVLRRETVRAVDIGRFSRRPHEGPLLYERRFRFPYDRFADAAGPFIARHLTDR